MEQTKNPWTIIDSSIIYSNSWIELTHFNVLNPNGGKGIYGKVHFKNKAVGVIPIDANGNTYLVGQYRFTLNEYSWEIPEGGCPHSEDTLDAGKRELLEETGLVAQNWQLIGKSYLSNSVSDEIAYYYIATGLSQATAEPEETEDLKIKKLPLQEVFAMVNQGKITDSLSIMALQKLELLLLKKEIILI